MIDNPTYQELENQIIALKKQNELIKMNSSIQSDELYHSLIDNMSEGFAHCQMIYEHDVPIDFIYLEVNKAFEKLTGLKDVVGKRISEVLINHKDENTELFNLYDRVSKTGLSEKIETYIESLDIWFSISVYSSQKGQFLVFFDNVTERKRSEKILRLSEEQFRSLYTQSHVGTAIVGLDKCFIRCNQAFCKFLGYSEKEIIGKKIADFTHPEDLSIGMSDMKQVAEGIINFAVVQKRYLRKDGTIVWGELTISLVHGEDNKPLYFLPVIQDITERYLAVKNLEESEKNLKKLNDTKDKLFSIIAHDLKSPFNGFLGISNLLVESVDKADSISTKKYANILISSAKNTLILLDNLLNWAKSQTGQIDFNPQKFLLSSIIEEILDLSYLQSMSKNISINQIYSDNIEVYADKNLIKIVLRNLISNAIKFTRQGGSINIGCDVKKDNSIITISDNGIGMNKDSRDRLFNLSTNYSTLGTQNEKGSGLGLILCKELVEKHRGKIWVESKEGKGSDFKFTLPSSR